MFNQLRIYKKDLVYPELSYQIIGVLFETYNELGGGLQEKYYQRAVALNLRSTGLKFQEQVVIPLKIVRGDIGNY
jgi:GxxExxY protein